MTGMDDPADLIAASFRLALAHVERAGEVELARAGAMERSGVAAIRT